MTPPWVFLSQPHLAPSSKLSSTQSQRQDHLTPRSFSKHPGSSLAGYPVVLNRNLCDRPQGGVQRGLFKSKFVKPS